MIDLLKKYNKIFVVGVPGSGKTYFAKKYSELLDIPYIDYDANYNYFNANKVGETLKLLSELPQRFIIDNVVHTDFEDLFVFEDYYKKYKNEILFVVNCCTDKKEYEKRVEEKFLQYKVYCFDIYYEFYKVRQTFRNLNSIFYDSFNNDFISYDVLLQRITWLGNDKVALMKSVLKELFDRNWKYDKTYQDIECLDYIGYTRSQETWDDIKDLVDWKGKNVADLGCLNCCFSFKAKKAGANLVTGFTNNKDEIVMSSNINAIEGNIIEVKEWQSGKEIPYWYDVTLVLNCLHWFPNIRPALRNIKSPIVIFETNVELIDFIKEYFVINKQAESHRFNTIGDNRRRIILLCERIPEKVIKKKNINILTVTGIRPDFIRMSHIFEKFDKHFNHTLVHTGQHYDEMLSNVFFNELQIRKPNYNLEIGGEGKEHFHQTADLSVKLIELIREKDLKPDLICFLGDSNSVVSAVALKKEGYKIAHIEAGMRSGDKRMLEEINRTVCDHCSDYLFVYHENYKNNLSKENINENVFVVGNTIVEVVQDYVRQLKLKGKKLNQILLDIHRPENFKYEDRLRNIILFANTCSDKYNVPVRMLDFKRTTNKINEFNIDLGKIELIPLLSYQQYLQNAYDSLFVISDSGTAQEELAILDTHVIVPRDYTERWESVKNSCSIMLDVNSQNKTWDFTLAYIDYKRQIKTEWLGNGTTSDEIINIITKMYE